ncbi:helix-turn-helix domain-containing protein [Methylophilus medardicus]|uniref:Helix-turn-helix transcriptional regulator n=1 Tax=Methylophilus medardicus TaxID=2588534 RepID=A0A5B8CQR2_9PROT|nr:helix-turn-helix transcriptional regulator [Methylophilus medardicus]QDC43604.1 helix-turn-helix transcriptional regulator [Methylophilus medardicus]QDC48611.1 helix-turn-helix transcriptional regulator [Methylophilus medardicus]QDC52316.1 helix-turn-helix transcriptional regulator [Methylophilus medardicus]
MKTTITSGQQLKAHIKSLRKRRNWTQQMLATKMGLSQSRIVQIERNPNLVSFDQLLLLFNILGVSMSLELNSDDQSNESPDSTNKHSETADLQDAQNQATESKQAKW